MSEPNDLSIRGGHLFLNYMFFWQGGLINTAGFVNPNLILVSTQVPWRVDVGFMEVSCRFHRFLCLNMVVAWRLLTDAVFMGVPRRFRGGLM